MAFRGVLLQLVEAESATGFHVVAPDAELMLPPRTVSARETFLTQWSQQKIVVADAVTHKLQQVARLATVTLQREERSVLWGATATFVSSKRRTVGTAPLASYVGVPQTVQMTHVITAAASHEVTTSLAVAVSSSNEIATADKLSVYKIESMKDDCPPERLCYCFHFRSDFEYDLFASTFEAFTRMQRYALLQRSVLMEMEITQELKQRRKEEGVRLQVASSKAKKRRERKDFDKSETQNRKPMQIQIKAKPEIKAAIPASKMICVLCRTQKKSEGPNYPKHPFVLKDGKGEVVHICKVCLQHVLQKRLALPPVATKGNSDNYCGLCGQSTENLPAKSVKACTHNLCTRVYCLPCIDKLIGRAQSHKVWRTKNWLCPNCSIITPSTKQIIVSGEATSSEPAKAYLKINKRKRRNEIDGSITADEDEFELPELASTAFEMEPIDYVAAYFKFLLKREMKDHFEESEDVCFCCKDGGDVIECDWKGMNSIFARCPKVYHEECLGYKVPEGKTWVCPRHRCQDCGIIAQFSCRFCVTSYCEGHLPEEVKRLGNATNDIPSSTYVMCFRCNQQAQDALKQRKIGPDLYSKLLRPRAKR